MSGYVIYSFALGRDWGMEYLWDSVSELLISMLFIVLAIGSIRIFRGRIASLGVIPGLDFFSRRKLLAPVNSCIELQPSPKFQVDEKLLPKESLEQSGRIEKHFFIDDKKGCYLLKLSDPLQVNGYLPDKLMLIPEWENHRLGQKGKILVRVYLIPSEEILNEPFLSVDHLELVGRVFSEGVTGT